MSLSWNQTLLVGGGPEAEVASSTVARGGERRVLAAEEGKMEREGRGGDRRQAEHLPARAICTTTGSQVRFDGESRRETRIGGVKAAMQASSNAQAVENKRDLSGSILISNHLFFILQPRLRSCGSSQLERICGSLQFTLHLIRGTFFFFYF